MFKMKQWGIAATLALTAVGAMASNFRASDQVYLPIAGHVGTFASDVWLSNLSDDPVTVSIIFSSGPTGSINTSFPTINLQPRERRELPDFFGQNLGITNGLGVVVFNACKQGADCVTTQDQSGVSQNFRNITVESRVANFQATGTTGQDIPGLPWYNFVSMDQAANGLDKVFIVGVRNTTQYRTNIGLVNASQFSNTTLKVTLHSSNGTILGTYNEALGPLGQAQRSIQTMFPSFTTAATSTGAWVEVEQVSSTPTADAPQGCTTNGCPAFFTYGSQLDNVTGDPTTLEAQYSKPLSDQALLAIYPSGAGKSPIRRVVRH